MQKQNVNKKTPELSQSHLQFAPSKSQNSPDLKLKKLIQRPDSNYQWKKGCEKLWLLYSTKT
jgi:hypothetical protein